MYVCELESCLFCVYLKKDFIALTIPVDCVFIEEEIIPKSRTFVTQVIIPELTAKYWTEGRYQTEHFVEPDVDLYDAENSLADPTLISAPKNRPFLPCYCNGRFQIAGNDILIKCASPSCHCKYYHRSCLERLGKKRFPSSWLCDACRKSSKQTKTKRLPKEISTPPRDNPNQETAQILYQRNLYNVYDCFSN